jgi:hypothetical protein
MYCCSGKETCHCLAAIITFHQTSISGVANGDEIQHSNCRSSFGDESRTPISGNLEHGLLLVNPVLFLLYPRDIIECRFVEGVGVEKKGAEKLLPSSSINVRRRTAGAAIAAPKSAVRHTSTAECVVVFMVDGTG